DIDGVGAALLADTQALGGDAVHAGEATLVFKTVLNEGDFMQVNRHAADFAHHDVAQVIKFQRFTEHADIHFAADGFNAAGGKLNVLAAQGGHQVGNGEALAVQFVGV